MDWSFSSTYINEYHVHGINGYAITCAVNDGDVVTHVRVVYEWWFRPLVWAYEWLTRIR